MDKNWICPQCTLSNSFDTLVCVACNYPETVIQDFQLISELYEKKDFEAKSPVFWSCNVCTYNNKLTAEVCEVCETAKPIIETTPSTTKEPIHCESYWICSYCANKNLESELNCKYCGIQDRGPLDQEEFSLRSSTERLGVLSFNSYYESKYGATVQKVGKPGVLFKVWAPHADRAFVSGTWNGWSTTEDEMQKDSHGIFRIYVPDAKEGDRYKFVFYQLSDKNKLMRNDPRAPAFVHETYGLNSVIYEPLENSHSSFVWSDQKFVTPPYQKLIIYEMHVGAFGSQNEKNSGTFLACIDKLDHLADLGINCVEMMPINQDIHSECWGYDPLSLFSIHRQYGTPNDLKKFIDEAHKRAIAVIIDWVPNHLSPGNILEKFDSSSGGSYFPSDSHLRNTEYGPKLDYSNLQVRQYVKDSLLMWLCDFHFDGIRVDSVVTMRKTKYGESIEAWTLLQECTDMVRRLNPTKILIAEDLQNLESIHHISGFDSQWDGRFFSVMFHACSILSDKSRNMHQISEVIQKSYLGKLQTRVIYTESHDTIPPDRQKRIPQAIATKPEANYYAIKRSLLATTVLFTAVGIPMILQGQEIFEISSYKWPIPPLINWARIKHYTGIYECYRALISFRTNKYNLTGGLTGDGINVFHINDISKVIAYHRYSVTGPGDDVIVVANFSNCAFKQYKIGFPRPGVWEVRFNSDSKIFREDFENIGNSSITTITEKYDNFYFSGILSLGRYSAVILSQNRSKERILN